MKKRLYVKQLPATSANTVFMGFYNEADKNWLLCQLMTKLPEMVEKGIDDYNVHQYINEPNKCFGSYATGKMTKSGHSKFAYNSGLRLMSGILAQHLGPNGYNKDITRPQMKYIEALMEWISEPVEFVEQAPEKNLFNSVFSFQTK